jgi:outer membrane biosynthesis protein TonB
MSIANNREEARVILKKITSFNVINNYYQQDEKEEIAREFKKLLFIDEPTVRKFLDQLLSSNMRELAREFDLVGTDVEVNKAQEETTPEEEEVEKGKSEEEEQKDKVEKDINKGEEPKENVEPAAENQEEKSEPKLENFTIKRASELVDDLLEE